MAAFPELTSAVSSKRFVAVVLGSSLLHGGSRLVTKDLEDALDTRLTEGTKAPQIGPSDAYRLRAHGQSLDDIHCPTGIRMAGGRRSGPPSAGGRAKRLSA